MRQLILPIFLAIWAVPVAHAFQGASASTSKAPILRIGEPAPSVGFGTLLNGGDVKDVTLADLKGKIVILEFWATWCGACLPAMDHLVHLQEEFADEIQVIAISDEDEEPLRKYLRRKPDSVWIGCDQGGKVNKRYDPQTIPHTVIIGRDGKIVAITRPRELTKERIQNLFNGQTVSFPAKSRVKKEVSLPSYDESTMYFNLRPSQLGQARTTISPDGRKYTARHRPVAALFQTAYQMRSALRIIHDVSDPDRTAANNALMYDFDLLVPEANKENLWSVMAFNLHNSLPNLVALETRKMKVKVLSVKTPGGVKLSKSKERIHQFRGPKFDGTKIELSDLAAYLENFSKVPVVDETRLNEQYDISIEWEFSAPGSLGQELNRLGLSLDAAEREIQVLVFRDAP